MHNETENWPPKTTARRLASDPGSYMLLRKAGNFEDALSQAQADARSRPTPEARARLEHVEHAILDTFGEMNRTFARLPGIEFSQDVARSIQRYLSRFDVIYTLNQDLLLELHYNIESVGHAGHDFLGVTPPPNWRALPPDERISATWNPGAEFKVDARTQPIFKLHGSVNWRDPQGGQLLVVGGNKQHVIDKYPLLRWYFNNFRESLFAGNAKLMVIGYSFLDESLSTVRFQRAEST